MSRSKETWNRIKPLPKKVVLEKIRVWDYVDSVEHCIDIRDLSIHLCTRKEMEENSNYESIENVEGGLEYVYGKVHSI